MWSPYLFLNKILKPEGVDGEDNDQERDEACRFGDIDNMKMVKSLAFEHLSSHGKYHLAVLPREQLIDVPHLNQLASWDCGLACILMVLRTVGIDTCDINTLSDLCGTNSIWTVDLAYLLQKFSISFCFYTVTIGANPGYSDETFYKDQLSTDVQRVDKLFNNALAAGIAIECRSISDEEISLLILSGQYVAIALVDQYKLSVRSWFEDVCLSNLHDSSTDYTGHYIVICGYDADKDEFEIRDPASSLEHEKVSSKCLKEARKSFGTDEDLLLIFLDKEGKNGINACA